MSDTVKPISPDQISSAKLEHIPDVVIKAFNKLIALNFSNGVAEVKQNDVMNEIYTSSDFTKQNFNSKWLNIEEMYEQAGWKVVYYKRAYYDEGSNFFEFRVEQ